MSSIAEADQRWHVPRGAMIVLGVLSGLAVIAIYAMTAGTAQRLGPYWTGIITLVTFVFLGIYSARKRSLWISVRVLRLFSFLPMYHRLIEFDSLRIWRNLHIVVGMFALLPFAWHMQIGLMSPLEMVLFLAVVLLILSGIFGTGIQELLPPAARKPGQEVRLRDIDARLNALYVEAEEMVLGHSEELVKAYLENIKPLLVETRTQSRGKLMRATLTGADPAPGICQGLTSPAASLGKDADVYHRLLDVLLRKLRTEQNDFNLHFSTEWLKFHIALAVVTGVLLTFHIAGALYFYGI